MLPRTNLSQIHIPNEFTIYPAFISMPAQPKEGFFYNTIVALAEVALGDYTEAMPARSFSSRRFPEPVIQLFTSGTDIQRKYVVWGLLISITNMLHISDWRYSVAVLLYMGVEVGAIGFGRQETVTALLHRHERNGATATRKLIGPKPQNRTTDRRPEPNTVTTTPLTANRVTVSFSPFGADVGSIPMFMAIISALSEAAVHPAATPLQGPFTSKFANFPCHFVSRPIKPPRSTPPVYEWRHLILALQQTVEYVVGQADYREMTMNIKADWITVGLASLFEDERILGAGENTLLDS
ncbi:MAG: hypothetical protein Q9171_002136 [Xanthocarpia ochracea]